MNPSFPLESQLKWLAGIVAVVVSLLMPAVSLVSSYQSRAGGLEGEARVTGLAVTEFINQNPRLWHYQDERLGTVLRNVVDGRHSARVIASDGRLIVGVGPAVSNHAISRSRDFHDFGRVAGRVELSAPVDDILEDTVWLVLAGSCVGVLVFFPLRNLPLRALGEATRALRESEERNRTVVASLAEGVTMVDRAGRVLIVNDGARAIFGPRLANWLACRDTAAFARDAEGNSLSDADHPTGKAFASGRARRNTLLRLDRTEGDSVWILVNTQPLLDPASGATSAVVTSVIDVSEEREREQALGRARDAAEAASRVKSQFLANMSHEIRTPMNGVLGMAELLAADATLNDRQRHYLDVIRDSGESLLRVIDDILDFSKIEAGRLSLNAEEFDLRQRVAMTLGLMETRAHAKGLELTWTVADDVPSWMKGDAARLHQILANLVGNAVKFTERGAVRVTVELAADPRPSEELRRVRIAVSDTGIGIPPTYLPRMFRLFSQEDESNSRRFGGTGLGLAISRQLVELMGGEIGVESEPGKGSTFWFTVPLGEAAEPAGASRPAPVEARTRLSGRVLVVEDEPTNRLLARETLRVLGCVPEAVEDGQAALDWLAREACDVVLMDCQMPGLDGFETTARIRERGCLARNGGRIPIVALTASALSGDRDRCLAAGMDDYLSKPFSREALRATLLRWLPARGRQP